MMILDSLIQTSGPVDSLTLEKAVFRKRRFAWKEGERILVARFTWNAEGQLVSREEDGEIHLYAYGDHGLQTACYRVDDSGQVSGRELREYDDRKRLTRRILKTLDPPAEETWTYEHDEAGRMMAEKRGGKVRVEKRDREGRLEQEYHYEGEIPDLVTEYTYDEHDRVVKIIVRDPDGKEHRRTHREWDEEGRIASEFIQDAEGMTVKDEIYAYGAALGTRWLEQVTWIPDGRRGGKRRPKEVLYRSFTLQESRSDETGAESNSVAFANGVYHGPTHDGKPHGKGIFHYNDESRYEGEFRDGTMTGPGRLEWPDGRRLEGRFENGLLEGRGFCAWSDGSLYEGPFLNGKMHGPGIFSWPDGTRFEGLFENGRRTDQGAWEKPGE